MIDKIVQYSEPEIRVMDDGGEVALLWALLAGERSSSVLSNSAPVLCIFHSIVFDPTSDVGIARLAAEALRRGFRPVVFLRRGHIPKRELATPCFQLVADTKDSRAMIAAVRERWPEARLVAIGHSAGTGTIARYTGEEKSNCQFSAVSMNCPGYYTTPPHGCFNSVGDSFLLRYVVRFAKEFFVTGPQHCNFWDSYEKSNKASARILDSLNRFKQASTMAELWGAVAGGIGGYESNEAFYEAVEPMAHIEDIAVPCMVVNARDDKLCTLAPQYLRTSFLDHAKKQPVISVLTRRGSHCAFYDLGVVFDIITDWGRERMNQKKISWADRLCLDFLESALTELEHAGTDLILEGANCTPPQIPQTSV